MEGKTVYNYSRLFSNLNDFIKRDILKYKVLTTKKIYTIQGNK